MILVGVPIDPRRLSSATGQNRCGHRKLTIFGREPGQGFCDFLLLLAHGWRSRCFVRRIASIWHAATWLWRLLPWDLSSPPLQPAQQENRFAIDHDFHRRSHRPETIFYAEVGRHYIRRGEDDAWSSPPRPVAVRGARGGSGGRPITPIPLAWTNRSLRRPRLVAPSSGVRLFRDRVAALLQHPESHGRTPRAGPEAIAYAWTEVLCSAPCAPSIRPQLGRFGKGAIHSYVSARAISWISGSCFPA